MPYKDLKTRKQYMSDYAKANRTHLTELNKTNSKLRKIKLDEFRVKPCADCGNTYPPYVMDFDHVRGTKLFNIAQQHRHTWQEVLDEVAKCDVVCSNCHRIRTHNNGGPRRAGRTDAALRAIGLLLTSEPGLSGS